MESKRKSFAKSKLLKSIYRGGGKPKPDTPLEFMANEAMKSKAPPPPKAAVGYIIVKKDQVFPPHQKPKIAFVVPDRNAEYAKLENFVYGGAADDEAVDAKAARYISSVQERFQLELINSESNNLQDMQLV